MRLMDPLRMLIIVSGIYQLFACALRDFELEKAWENKNVALLF